MGLLDWFSGKKKAEYREQVKEAVGDGKLTEEKLARLEALRKQANIDHIGTDKTEIRRSTFNTAVKAVKSGGKMTDTEEAELANIQKFLNLSDDQVDKTRIHVRHMKTATEIAEGQLPVVPPENAALKGLRLLPDEVAHHVAAAELFDSTDADTKEGFEAVKGETYRIGSADSVLVPVDNATPKDKGYLVLTSKRIIFRGSMTFAHEYGKLGELHLYRDGLRLPIGNSNMLIRFRSDGVSDVVATLIRRLRR
ncbi:MAG: hypothetical protein H6R18_387 [Proteobacteria bacterium]|nr:hypothetical protein [Pseudomonadota bacterium]